MDIRTSAFAIAITAAFAAGAQAGEPEKAEVVEMDPAPTFEEMDADQNGNISTSEAEGTWLADLFTVVDANEDGLVDEAEYIEATS